MYQGLGDGEVAISDLYDKGISTASLSKVTSFAGLRLGWVKANYEVIKLIMIVVIIILFQQVILTIILEL